MTGVFDMHHDAAAAVNRFYHQIHLTVSSVIKFKKFQMNLNRTVFIISIAMINPKNVKKY